MKIFTFICLSLLLASCSTAQKLDPKKKKEINNIIFNYHNAKIKTLNCKLSSDITQKAASIGRATKIVTAQEWSALNNLRIHVQLSSEKYDAVKFNLPELTPFSNELAKDKLMPFVDASKKMIHHDLMVLNTLMALPVLDEKTPDYILSETTSYYNLKSSSKIYKFVTVYKDGSKIILEPTNSNESLRTVITATKSPGNNFHLIRTSIATNSSKDIHYQYDFTYELQNNIPVPSVIKVQKKDFDIEFNYQYTFNECTF